MTRTLSVALIALALLAVACARGAADRGPEPGEEVFGRWRLTELDGAAAPAGEAPSLELFEDGSIAGDAGVNRFHGRADADGLRAGRFASGPLATTRMAGPPERMELERRFLEALGRATEVRVRGGELELLRDGRVLARFAARA